MRPITPNREFFLQRAVVVPIECWEWRGAKIASGYAVMGRAYRGGYAHRWAYEHFVGPIPPGLCIDHMCENKGCVNPTHMRVLTSGQNSLASGNSPTRLNSLKTACSKCGGPFVHTKKGRICRPCVNAYARETQRKIHMDPVRREHYRRVWWIAEHKRRAARATKEQA